MEYEISTIKQIAELDERQQKDFLVDLAAWLEFNRLCKALSGDLIKVNPQENSIFWRDDGMAGKISGIKVNFV